MWNVVGLAFVCLFIAAVEGPRLVQGGMRRELIVFVLLLLAGFAVSSLHALRVALPNPLTGITMVFRPISDWTFGILK